MRERKSVCGKQDKYTHNNIDKINRGKETKKKNGCIKNAKSLPLLLRPNIVKKIINK